jgi:polar amino acid transport system substrate-binding protein
LRRRALLAGGQGLQAEAWAGEVLTIYAPERYEPLIYRERGQAKGLLVERLRAVAKSISLQHELVLTSWTRALIMAERGEGGLLGVSRTPERELWLDYSQPLGFDELLLVVRTGQGVIFNGLSDLYGRRVGLARRSTGGAAFDAAVAQGRIQVLEDETAVQRLQALRAGRIDAAVIGGGRATLDRALHEHPFLRGAEQELQVLPKPLLRDGLHLGFHKRLGLGGLLARIDAALPATDQPR